jgi:hypothetical protein
MATVHSQVGVIVFPAGMDLNALFMPIATMRPLVGPLPSFAMFLPVKTGIHPLIVWLARHNMVRIQAIPMTHRPLQYPLSLCQPLKYYSPPET